MRALVVMLAMIGACGGAPRSAVDKQASAAAGTPLADAAPPDAPVDAAIPRPSQAELTAAETTAWARAKPVFDRYCTKCHTKRGRGANAKRLDALDLTKYPPGGRYAKQKLVAGAIRDVLGQSGPPAKMPFDKPGAVQGSDLALVLAWCDAWDRAHAP